MKHQWFPFLLVAAVGCNLSLSRAQEVHFSQAYANPLRLNPALAGSEKGTRVTLHYRHQWWDMASVYQTFSASYDRALPSIRSGVGVQVYRDNAGNGTLQSTSVSATYAYQVPLSRELSLRAGSQATWRQHKLDWERLTFEDQVDARYGFIYDSRERPGRTVHTTPDFSSGVMLMSRHYFIGVSVYHLLQGNEPLTSGTSAVLPRRLSLQAGYIHPFDRKNPTLGSISPNVIVVQQAGTRVVQLGFYAQRGVLTGGIWYRHGQALTFLAGLQHQSLRFGYSFDLTYADFQGPGTAHELSLGVHLPSRRRWGRKRHQPVPCPTF
ncbi:MAG: type IX secretion system membrane protein PorP/SprF [Bacteroidota bacterium]